MDGHESEASVKHGLWLRTNGSVSDAVRNAIAAEDAGWDGVFVADSIWGGWADPWTILSAIAVQTENIRIGTWVTPLPHKTPWWLANTVATLDRLSNGRVILGVGLGEPLEYEMFGSQLDTKALGRKVRRSLRDPDRSVDQRTLQLQRRILHYRGRTAPGYPRTAPEGSGFDGMLVAQREAVP